MLNEINLGVEQYVILGAGLDTFGFRYPELNNSLKIFEIDHPATQEFKKKKLKDVKLNMPKNLHFVSMDFTNKFSKQDLIDKGFDNKPTFFSLLGVSYYLTKEENARLISHLFTDIPRVVLLFLIMQTKNYLKKKGCLIELKIW